MLRNAPSLAPSQKNKKEVTMTGRRETVEEIEVMSGMKMSIKASEYSNSENTGLSLRGQVEVEGNST